MKATLDSSNNNNSPGEDGIVSEFYKKILVFDLKKTIL